MDTWDAQGRDGDVQFARRRIGARRFEVEVRRGHEVLQRTFDCDHPLDHGMDVADQARMEELLGEMILQIRGAG